MFKVKLDLDGQRWMGLHYGKAVDAIWCTTQQLTFNERSEEFFWASVFQDAEDGKPKFHVGQDFLKDIFKVGAGRKPERLTCRKGVDRFIDPS